MIIENEHISPQKKESEYKNIRIVEKVTIWKCLKDSHNWVSCWLHNPQRQNWETLRGEVLTENAMSEKPVNKEDAAEGSSCAGSHMLSITA